MNLKFNTSLIKGYKSKSQIARVLTEDWFARNMYCPICGESSIRKAEPNAPVKDYICDKCKSQYELKSKKSNSRNFESTVTDGAYQTMINRITSLDNPSFFFMHYDRYEVNNLVIVPKCFFTPAVIEKRVALTETAQRARWIGCNIIMKAIPSIAKIPIIQDSLTIPIKNVVNQFNKVYNLQTQSIESRGWLVDVLTVIEQLEETFTLNQVYSFTRDFQIRHPQNHHIQDKIRQQLQFLRDKGIIEFIGRGIYKKIKE